MDNLKNSNPGFNTEGEIELNCLYNVDEALNNTDQTYEQAFNNLVEIIPTGWRFTDICKVQINYNDLSISTEGYKNTELKQIANIFVEGKNVGEIRVCYIKPVRVEKGIFLNAEHRLLSNISDKISKFILLKRLKETIQELKLSEPTKKDKISDKLFHFLKNNNLTDSEIDQITQVKLNFKKGEMISKQGSITTYVMILAEGLCKNFLEASREKGFNFKIVKPVDFIGLSSLYGNNYYQFSTQALTNCTVYLVEKEVLKNIVSNNPAFAGKIMEWYCSITEGHLLKLSSIANKQTLGKIAEVLLYLSDVVFNNDFIPNTISRKDIAELAAMSTEGAVRILSELKKDKIIKTNTLGIEITNKKLLERFSKAG
jgi:CRP-like cAMP-binding protein